jgi:hypothetical protein
MTETEFAGSERRSYFRILYKPTKRPKLSVDKNEFEIADISEGGIRFINEREVDLGQQMRGTATFLMGESVDIEGDIVWKQDGEIGLLLKSFIPPAMMEKEKQFVILSDNSG